MRVDPNYITNLASGISANSAALEGFETIFHQDLNGDGSIGVTTTVIETFGSTIWMVSEAEPLALVPVIVAVVVSDVPAWLVETLVTNTLNSMIT